MSAHPSTGAPAGPDAPGPVLAVGVLVPARDEHDHIEACLHAVLDTLGGLPPEVATALCVVVDRSRDGTGALARRMLTAGVRPVVDVVPNEHPVTVGDLRNLGAATRLRRLGSVAPERTWLLSTDADSTVGPDWAHAHLRQADAGADAVAGGVELDGPGRLDTPVSTDAAPGRPAPDPPLYAANLGVRGAPFLGVGGFPSVPSGEEHALVDRLRRAGGSSPAPRSPSGPARGPGAGRSAGSPTCYASAPPRRRSSRRGFPAPRAGSPSDGQDQRPHRTWATTWTGKNRSCSPSSARRSGARGCRRSGSRWSTVRHVGAGCRRTLESTRMGKDDRASHHRYRGTFCCH